MQPGVRAFHLIRPPITFVRNAFDEITMTQSTIG
jgi:hypothetical protein